MVRALQSELTNAEMPMPHRSAKLLIMMPSFGRNERNIDNKSPVHRMTLPDGRWQEMALCRVLLARATLRRTSASYLHGKIAAKYMIKETVDL